MDDFYHKILRGGRHCETAKPTKQSIHIKILRSSVLIAPEELRLATPRLPIAPNLSVAPEGLQKGRLIGLR
jgi:hypothetical protein